MKPVAVRPQLIALIVASCQFMSNLDSSIVNTSLPQMAGSFGVTPVDLSVGVTAYVIASAAFIPLSGWAAARFGSRRVFASAVAVFTLASIACGASATLWQFVIARGVQGLGGALMAPVGQAIVLRNTEKSALIRAIALITWPALLAPVLGPVLGGAITTYASWRWNFLLNAPLGLCAISLILLFIPREAAAPGRTLDLRGFVLTSAALVCLIEGLEMLIAAENRWLSLALLAFGAVVAVLAVRRLRQAEEPLLNLTPLKEQTYRLAVVDAGLAFRGVINATPFLLPLMFQVGWGLNPAQSGALLLIYFLGNIGIKPATTPILRRFGFRTVLIGNGVLIGASLLVCAGLTPAMPKALLAPLLFFAGAVRSMQFTALNTMSYSEIGPQDKASASTLSNMMQQTSLAIGVAGAALLLQAAKAWRGDAVSGIADFRIAFVAVGLIGLVAALRFRALDPDAGAEVSGHGAKVASKPVS